ncbi:hypothetical protein [Pseudoxanthomonas sp. GW2]|uniref:hypothetical protein n=1 Tax=Pseudoxanthomonas sp. GW2 TaxID=1211114 RepID=UPI0002F6B6C8|nr:hypothetical protein [Pseudoxanthomonas sp. GW2]
MSFLYRLSFRLPFTSRVLSLLPAQGPNQHGFWIDRLGDYCTLVGLGRVVLYVERAEGAPLLRLA